MDRPAHRKILPEHLDARPDERMRVPHECEPSPITPSQHSRGLKVNPSELERRPIGRKSCPINKDERRPNVEASRGNAIAQTLNSRMLLVNKNGSRVSASRCRTERVGCPRHTKTAPMISSVHQMNAYAYPTDASGNRINDGADRINAGAYRFDTTPAHPFRSAWQVLRVDAQND